MSQDMTGKETGLKMMLFDNLLNSFSSTNIVGVVGILYFCINIVSTK